MPYLLVPPLRHLPAFEEALVAQLQEIEQHAEVSRGELANASIVHKLKKTLVAENEKAYRAISKAARESDLSSKAPETQLLKKMLRHQRRILNEFSATVK